MKKFRKIWTEETDGFLREHRDLCRRGGYDTLLAMFLERFPDSGVGRNAIKTECSRIGITVKKPHGSTKALPLYTEQEKKDYIRIKVAQPSVWWSKARWVYVETHPWEDCSERSNYIFLDGNNRNFAPDNIARVPLYLMGLFNGMGGTGATPEETRLRLRLAELKWARNNLGEKLGLTVQYGSGRRFRTEQNQKAREFNRNMTAEQRKRRNKRQVEYVKRRKANDPEYAEKLRQYQKDWIQKSREKQNER